MPSTPSSFLASVPAATRAAVSRALARSSTSRASSKPYFCMPARSAWPGRGWVSGAAVAPGAGDISACHLSLRVHSVLPISMATGLPERAAVADAAEQRHLVLLEAHARPAAEPSRRRASSAWTSSTVIGRPAGRPSTITTRAWPWLSPAVR